MKPPGLGAVRAVLDTARFGEANPVSVLTFAVCLVSTRAGPRVTRVIYVLRFIEGLLPE